MKRDIYKLVGDNLQVLRKLHNLSQEKLGEQLHISRATYNQLENGRQLPSLDILLSLCSIYNISIDSILFFDCQSVKKTIVLTDNFRSELDALIDIFSDLSPISKGALLERAECLLALDERNTYEKYLDKLFQAREGA